MLRSLSHLSDQPVKGGWTPAIVATLIVGGLWSTSAALAVLAFFMWRGGVLKMVVESVRYGIEDIQSLTFAGSGNRAFDSWRRAEDQRLRNALSGLAITQREFVAWESNLRLGEEQVRFSRFSQHRRQDLPATEHAG